jgi:hypothetical protein
MKDNMIAYSEYDIYLCGLIAYLAFFVDMTEFRDHRRRICECYIKFSDVTGLPRGGQGGGKPRGILGKSSKFSLPANREHNAARGLNGR